MRDETKRQYELFDGLTRRLVDKYSTSGRHIHCHKGCRECCNLAVNSTYVEALCVAEILTDEQIFRVKSHGEKLLRHVGEISDLKGYLRMQRTVIGFCPLLNGDGACGVYGKRPFSCRSLLSTMESNWCGTDFSLLSRSEKQAFMDSLDREVVAFPMHYLAASRDLGEQFESRTALVMAEEFGFTVTGNLPFLLYLETEHGLGNIMCHGYDITMDFLHQARLFNPFLIAVDHI